MAYLILSLDAKPNFEFAIEAFGDVIRGGSDRHGSDEPAWVEVENVKLYHPESNRPVSARTVAKLTDADWERIDAAIAGDW